MARTDPALADELVSAVRTFVEKEVTPVASDLEHRDEYPADLVRQMAELGLFGAVVPEEFGGLGLDVVTYARLIEELATGWMSLTGVLNSHMMAATLIRLYGTEDQKRRLLPKLATGEVRGCLSLSEPDAGSDTRALRCRRPAPTATGSRGLRPSPALVAAASSRPRSRRGGAGWRPSCVS